MNGAVRSSELSRGLQADAAVVQHMQGLPKQWQHALSVVAGWFGFPHAGLPLGIKARQQDTGFDLRTGDFGNMMDALQAATNTPATRGVL